MNRTLVVGVIAASLLTVPAAVSAAPSSPCFGKSPTIVGTNGDDVIYGTSGNDVIKALAGNDTIFGLGGADLICAGSGDDRVFGGPGNDKVWGAGGDDRVFGGSGNDIMFGVWGNDWFNGQAGTDTSREGARWGETKNVEVPRTIPVRTGMVRAAGLRVKGAYGGKEVYVGVHDLGVGGNRSEVEFSGLSGGGSASVEFSWDPSTQTLSADVDGASASFDVEAGPAPACSPNDWDIMEIFVRDSGPGVTFENAEFNGNGMNPAFSDEFSPNRGYEAWTGGPLAVVMMDMDFQSAWTITGDLVSVGAFTGNEANKLELLVGCKTHPDRVLGA